jgi:hypothetical protein
VQSHGGALYVLTKWGELGEWDVSKVTDFSRVFSKNRNEAGASAASGNAKAASFAGFAAISKWKTTSATTLHYMFSEAGAMNADLAGWDVSNVVSLENTFYNAASFVGTGIDAWDVAKVVTANGFSQTFRGAAALSTCNKKRAAHAWTTLRPSATFVANSDYSPGWAMLGDKYCTTAEERHLATCAEKIKAKTLTCALLLVGLVQPKAKE